MTGKATIDEWQTDNDDIEVASNSTSKSASRHIHHSPIDTSASSVHRNDRHCCIGLDKSTGRVKWCPNCEYVKYCILLPLILLPIIVVLILMMQINSYHGNVDFVTAIEIAQYNDSYHPSFDHEQHHYRRDSRNVKEEPTDTTVKCNPIRHFMSEIHDIHEKEIFRDIQTSFVPSESISRAMNCLRHRLNNKSINNNGVDSVNDIDNDSIGSIYGVNSNSGNRTNQLDGDNLRSTNIRRKSIAAINEKFDGDDRRKLPTEKHRRRSRRHNLRLANGLNESDAAPLNIPALLKTFWKGGKTREQIRHSQVEIMKQYIDESATPCDDFYQYACGNWEKYNPIPKDKGAYDTFELLREILDIELNSLLAEKTNKNKSASVFQATEVGNTLDEQSEQSKVQTAEEKAQILYESCMNEAILEKRGIEPLIQLLKSLGGWPVLEGDDWNADTFDWLRLAGQLRLFNNDIFLTHWIGPDIKNSDENVIHFDQPSLGLPTREHFLQESNGVYLNAYKKYIADVISLCGASEEDGHRAANEILAFEIKLANITASPEERENVSQIYHRMNVGALERAVPEIDWRRYLEIVLEREVNYNETIIMFASPIFMYDLVQLLNATDSKTIANYMFWKFVRHRINNLDDRFLGAKQKFYNVLIGREKSPPRWKTCVNQVNSNMGMAVGAMFVRKYFDEKSKQDTLAMTHEIQESFRIILNETNWIDESTRALAELKLNGMSLKIGYPDYILNRNELNAKYKDLDIHPDRYFENILKMLRHLTRNEQRKLSQAVNRTTWNTAPAVVNAYYSRNKNQIMFPAGILQPPFYHRHLPRSLNFGGIGVVIGHELTHGFDDKGRLYDRDGNMNRWWSESAIEGFHQRTNCLITQYGNYKMTEIDNQAVNGTITQGENIADNGGIKQAFRAYERWLNEHCQSTECLEQEHLHGLNATNKQLFFINFAQVWCGAMRPEATKSKMKTAVHSPGRFRVIGTLSNLEEFAREFECAPGTPMNPTKKCSVW